MSRKFWWLFDRDAHGILYVLRRDGSATFDRLRLRSDAPRRRLIRLLDALLLAHVVGAQIMPGPYPNPVKYELTPRGFALTEVFIARAREARKHRAVLRERLARELEGPWTELDEPHRDTPDERRSRRNGPTEQDTS